LERLHRVMEIAHPKHGQDMSAALDVVARVLLPLRKGIYGTFARP
jgi:hypothetical protein